MTWKQGARWLDGGGIETMRVVPFNGQNWERQMAERASSGAR